MGSRPGFFETGSGLNQRAPGRRPVTRRIGHYGCAQRLVSIEVVASHPPTIQRILCPACEQEHVVNFMWRSAKEGEPEAEAHLEDITRERRIK